MKLMDYRKTTSLLTSILAASSALALAYSCSKSSGDSPVDDEPDAPEFVITDFEPKTGSVDNIITITGENFGTDKSNVRVTFGNQNAYIIKEVSDTKIVVGVPEIEVEKDTEVGLTVVVGDVSKTFDKKFAYVYVPYPGIWISGSFNNWSTDTPMEKDPVDPYTFHYTTDIIPSVPDENGERAFKFLTKSISWPWGNTYNAVQEKAPITDTRVVFQKNAGEAGVDWKWEFEPWQCGYSYEISLSIKPGEEKMTCVCIDGTPEAPKEYTTVSTLKTNVDMSDFRSIDFTADGKLVVVSDWGKIYTVDPKTGNSEILFNVDWEWDNNGPRELNSLVMSKDKKKMYLACPTTTKGAGDIFYLSADTKFAASIAIVTNMNKYSSAIAVNPADETIIFNAVENGETFYRLDSMDGKYSKVEGMKSLGGSNGGSRIYFNADGTKLYRIIYEGNEIYELGAIYVYDYDAATKTVSNEKLLAGHDSENGYADGKGDHARFHRPYGAAIDKGGNLYVADYDNHCIRKVTPDGVVTTFAGANEAGDNDGSLTEARFGRPTSIAIAEDGTMYVCQNGLKDKSAAGIRVIKY